jgi:hypothetical protein
MGRFEKQGSKFMRYNFTFEITLSITPAPFGILALSTSSNNTQG